MSARSAGSLHPPRSSGSSPAPAEEEPGPHGGQSRLPVPWRAARLALAEALLTGPDMRLRGISAERILEGLVARHLSPLAPLAPRAPLAVGAPPPQRPGPARQRT